VIILLVFLTLASTLLAQSRMPGFCSHDLNHISVIKAFFVVRDYMHIGRLFTSEEEF